MLINALLMFPKPKAAGSNPAGRTILPSCSMVQEYVKTCAESKIEPLPLSPYFDSNSTHACKEMKQDEFIPSVWRGCESLTEKIRVSIMVNLPAL